MVGILRASSTYDLLASWRSQTSDLQNQLNTASLEVATGIKGDVYKSLGFGSSEVLALRIQLDRNEGFIASNEILTNKLETAALSLATTRGIAQDVLNVAASNTKSPTASAKSLQAAARSAIEQITGQLNTRFKGAALFGGVNSNKTPVQDWNTVNASTGLSPSDVLAGVIGTGFVDATDAAQKSDALKDIFASNDTLQPDRNFEATFFNGSPLLQSGGSPTPRLQSLIDKNSTLSYGVQANDPEITNVLRGLSMIAATDVSKISDAGAYEAWMTDAVDALSTGITGLVTTEADLGNQQKLLADKVNAQRNLGDIFNSRISSLEGVDLYETSSRVLQLQTQLQATYTVTSRLSQLSFLNFL